MHDLLVAHRGADVVEIQRSAEKDGIFNFKDGNVKLTGMRSKCGMGWDGYRMNR